MKDITLVVIVLAVILVIGAMIKAVFGPACVTHHDLRHDHERIEALIYIAASNIYVKTAENGYKLDALLNIATNVNRDVRR